MCNLLSFLLGLECWKILRSHHVQEKESLYVSPGLDHVTLVVKLYGYSGSAKVQNQIYQNFYDSFVSFVET